MVTIGDGWSYQLRYVRCGKYSCRKCQAGYGHGPYWYAYRRIGGRVTSRYVGKLPPEAQFRQPPSGEPSVDTRWVFEGRMDAKTALRIMGFSVWPVQRDLQKRWRELVHLHHPDTGGDTRICAAINVAYGYLRR